jgi:hypothetical protein
MDTVQRGFKIIGFNNWKTKVSRRIDGEASLRLSSLEPSCCTDMMMIHVKYLLFLSDFDETWIFVTYFPKILKYQMSWISDLWEPSCPVRTDRHTWRDEGSLWKSPAVWDTWIEKHLKFSDAFEQLRKATISFVTSVRPHRVARRRQNEFLWNLILGEFSEKSVGKIQVALKSHNNNGHFTWKTNIHLWSYLT